MNFLILPSERVTIVGRTGSGKTTLARLLVGGDRNLVVIDPKWRFELPRTQLAVGTARAFAELWPQRSTRVVYRPDPESNTHDDVDQVIRRVLRYGRTRILVDEAMDYATPNAILPAYRRAETQGRELLVSMVSLTQRPRGIHNILLSEAEHLFVFDLAVASDREKVAAIGGDQLAERPGEPYAFWYVGPATNGAAVHCPPLRIPTAVPAPAPSQEAGGM